MAPGSASNSCHLYHCTHPRLPAGLSESGCAFRRMDRDESDYLPELLECSGLLHDQRGFFLGKKRDQSIRELYGKSILRIITCFVFWSAFYGAFYCFMTGNGKWTFLNQFLRGHYHMWFMFVIIGLYWVTPLIRQQSCCPGDEAELSRSSSTAEEMERMSL